MSVPVNVVYYLLVKLTRMTLDLLLIHVRYNFILM